MVFYHPGTCRATKEGRRHGNDSAPQTYDDRAHTWHLANTDNWGPWSCCGGDANTKGCRKRAIRSGLGAFIKFLLDKDAYQARVVGENSNSWLLSTGGTAEKAKHGSAWIWAQEYNSFRGPQGPFYSFGNSGYHKNSQDSRTMAGFSTTPPGKEICGTYKIMFVAALRPFANQPRASILLRRRPNSGSLIIEESTQRFTIGVGGRLGSTAPMRLTDQTIFSGEVFLPNESRSVDKYFGPGFKFFGFEADSGATASYPSMASNASLIVTKQNDNKGRIYRVEHPKAFKLVNNETGFMMVNNDGSSNQDQETAEARRVCKRRHPSFLCRELGLPCSASALIAAFATEQPFLFAEPGDVWIDICLSKKNRTYVLARRKPGVLPTEKVQLRANNMRMRFLRNQNEHELLTSVNEVLDTPNAGATILKVNLLYAVNGTVSELSPIIKMTVILFRNGKVSRSDINTSIMHLIYHIEAFAYDNPLVYDYVGTIFCVFLSIGVLTVKWLCEHASRLSKMTSKVALIEGAMKAVKKSFGRERTKDCFRGPSERKALESLLGLRSKRLFLSFC